MRPSENLTTRAIRLDDPQERARAVELLAQGIADIPHFKWLMGELMSTQLVRWLAEVTLSPARTDGVHGTFTDSGELCAVVVWSASDHTACAPDPDLVARGVELFGHDVGFMERYRQSQEPDVGTWSVPGALSVSVATVAGAAGPTSARILGLRTMAVRGRCEAATTAGAGAMTIVASVSPDGG